MNRLAAAVAAAAIVEPFNIGGVLHQLQGGRLIEVDRTSMREIVAKHIQTFALVNRGSADEPEWAVEYFPLKFWPVGSEGAMYGPDEAAITNLIDLITPMAMRTAGPRTKLKPQQLNEIRMRLKVGEPAARIARAYGVDDATIRAISLDR
jgi:hypothetical protein